MEVLITVLVSLVLICIWIWLYDLTHFHVTELEVTDPRINKSVKAVVLADLHNHQYGQNNKVLLEAIDELQPDVILVAGDMITAMPGRSLKVGVELMQALSATYPVLYGNGNHEQRLKLYPERYGDAAEVLQDAYSKAGIMVLDNKSLALEGTGICVYGLEPEKGFYARRHAPVMEKEYLDKELGTADEKQYAILLAHNPDFFDAYADWGADLTLSGHVHGGLVRIPIWGKGVISPRVKFFPKYDGGTFHKKAGDKEATMVVSRGLGCHTIPIRLFNQGELICIQFQPEKKTEE